MDDRAPCPFCNRPNAVKVQQQELYTHDSTSKVAILTPAGFAALDRYHEMTDTIEELNAERDQILSLIQRYQPAGSPPPGGPLELVRWVLESLSCDSFSPSASDSSGKP